METISPGRPNGFVSMVSRAGASGRIGAILVAAAMLSLAPTIISYAPYRPAWDDSYFMHRALTLGQEFRSADAAGMHDSLRDTFKSPIIAFLSLMPWALFSDPAAGPGLLHVSLAALELVFAALCFHIMWRCKMPPFVLLLSSASIALSPFVRSQAGEFLVDSLFSWVVLGTTLLVCLESRAPSGGNPGADARRGALWGLFICVGLLCKATYLFFGGLSMATAIFLHCRSYGRTSTWKTITAMTLVCLPAILMWMSFGKSYIHHAFISAWGATAAQYASGIGGWATFWPRYGTALGVGSLLLVPIAAVAVWQNRCSRQPWPCFVPAAVLMAYLVLASTSKNDVMRILLPAMTGMPFALGVLWRQRPDCRLSPLPIVLAFGILLLACLPEINRPQLDSAEKLGETLRQLRKAGCVQILVASDSANVLNVELMRLAKVMLGKEGRDLHINTVVYDDVNGIPRSESLHKIETADAVVFEQPLPSDPRFTNTRTAECLELAQSTMGRFEAGPGLLIYVRVPHQGPPQQNRLRP